MLCQSLRRANACPGRAAAPVDLSRSKCWSLALLLSRLTMDFSEAVDSEHPQAQNSEASLWSTRCSK